MIKKIADARPLTRYRVRLIFEDGQRKIYDAGNLVSRFSQLRKGSVFRKTMKSISGQSISWANDLDVPEEVLFTQKID